MNVAVVRVTRVQGVRLGVLLEGECPPLVGGRVHGGRHGGVLRLVGRTATAAATATRTATRGRSQGQSRRGGDQAYHFLSSHARKTPSIDDCDKVDTFGDAATYLLRGSSA